jgi:hypothetical protein
MLTEPAGLTGCCWPRGPDDDEADRHPTYVLAAIAGPGLNRPGSESGVPSAATGGGRSATCGTPGHERGGCTNAQPFATMIFSPGTEVKMDFAYKHSRVKQ